SGVLLVQIRDSLSTGARTLHQVEPAEAPSLPWRSLQWLSSPFGGLLSARTASNSFRNDNLLDLLDKVLNGPPPQNAPDGLTFSPDFFRIASFEFERDNS